MTKKAEVIVVQYDNGITLCWSDPEKEYDCENRVVLEGYEEKAIGEMIWQDVNAIISEENKKVLMKIEYQTIDF